MHEPDDRGRTLETEIGTFPLHEYRLGLAGRTWSILHTHAILSHTDEASFFKELRNRLPYGVALWPASIALAHEVASRADAFQGRRVLELGSGTGLPGIVAATLGGRVVQTDRHELALAVGRRNGERNGARTIEHRLADWADWGDDTPYDWILGSDILYGEAMHPHLRQIFAANLAPGGRILLADPFREQSLRLLGELEADGWKVMVGTWAIGEDATPRTIGIFELAPLR